MVRSAFQLLSFPFSWHSFDSAHFTGTPKCLFSGGKWIQKTGGVLFVCGGLGLFLLPNFSSGSWLIIWKVMIYGPSDFCRFCFCFLLPACFWEPHKGDLLLTPSLGRRKYFASKSLYSVVCYCKLKNNNLRNTSKFSREQSLVRRLMARLWHQVWHKSRITPLSAGPFLQPYQEQNVTLSLISEMVSEFIGALHVCRTFLGFAAVVAWCKSDFLAAESSTDYIWSSISACWSFVFLRPC